MSVVRFATTICDACGKSETSVNTEQHSFDHTAYRWGLLEWDEPPKDGETHRQYKDLSLCPEHLEMMLEMIASVKAKLIKPPVPDAP